MFHKQGQKPTENFSEAILELLVEMGDWFSLLYKIENIIWNQVI